MNSTKSNSRLNIIMGYIILLNREMDTGTCTKFLQYIHHFIPDLVHITNLKLVDAIGPESPSVPCVLSIVNMQINHYMQHTVF